MDPVSAAASIVALIQVAGKLAVVVNGYIGGVKRATQGMNDLMREVTSFNKVLLGLQDHAKDPACNGGILQGLRDELDHCRIELTSLARRLEQHKGKRRYIRSLKWPFMVEENGEIIHRIERYKRLFSLALNDANLLMSKKTEVHVKTIDASISAVNLSVQGLHAHARAESVANSLREEREKKKIRKEVLEWLYPGPVDTKHNEISGRRQPDTGDWLLESKEFRAIESGAPQILWGYGIPGAGKTFLSSRVIDHLQSKAVTENYGIAYIYFDYKEHDGQTPMQVFSSMVKQLAQQLDDLPTELGRLYRELENHGRRPLIEDLLRIVCSFKKSFNCLFLVFDAMDECNEQSQRRRLLPLFHRLRDRGARIFVTSRPHPEDLQRSFRDVPQIELAATDADITTYVLGRIAESPRIQGFIGNKRRAVGLEDKIALEIMNSAHGMFLLVNFHIEYLCQQTTVSQLLTALETLKLTTHATDNHPLDPTYDRVLECISEQSASCRELAMKILTWLVAGCRIFTVDEIRVATSLVKGQSALEDLDDLPLGETLLQVCGGLVTIDKSSNLIRLSHRTVHEYLVRKIFPKPVELQNSLATACITFMGLDTFCGGPCSTREEMDHRLFSLPLLEYITRHFPSHLQHADNQVAKSLFQEFYDQDFAARSWIQARRYFAQNTWFTDVYLSKTFNSLPPMLHMASLLGNDFVVLELLKEGHDTTKTTTRGEPVMHWAVMSGKMSIIRLLMEHGCDALELGAGGRSTLYQAAYIGSVEVVQYLLGCGLSVHTTPDGGMHPLFAAIWGGHLKVANLLLNNGASIAARDCDNATPLHITCLLGDEAFVQVLIERGGDAMAVTNSGKTSIHYAALHGNGAIMRLLLGSITCTTAAIGATDIYHQTALQLAVTKGHQSVVQILLDHGASPISLDGNGETSTLPREGSTSPRPTVLDSAGGS